MIKRHYFMSAQKPHNDGAGSYSFCSCTATFTSWFADYDFVRKNMADQLAGEMKHTAGDVINIISFNRI